MATMLRQTLTPEERRACWRLGAYAKFAEAGIRPSAVDATVKAAAGAAALLSPTGMAKMIATVAIVAGVPLGTAAHIVGKQIQKSRGREAELKTQIGYYRNAAGQLENGLAATGVQA